MTLDSVEKVEEIFQNTAEDKKTQQGEISSEKANPEIDSSSEELKEPRAKMNTKWL